MTDNKRRLSPEQQRQRRSEEGREQNRKKRAKKARNGKILTYGFAHSYIYYTCRVSLLYRAFQGAENRDGGGEQLFLRANNRCGGGVYGAKYAVALSR